jgi:hypothetical protein
LIVFIEKVVNHFRNTDFIEQLLTNKFKNGEEQFGFIKSLPYWYQFLAYEIYCDLDYFSPKIMRFGQDDYVALGPGAITGAMLIFPGKVDKKEDVREIIYHLRDNQEEYFRMFRMTDFPYLEGNKLSLREIEHSLCELSKYWKMKNNVGKQRQKFSPITNVF